MVHLQSKPLVLRDFSGGLNTSSAEPMLPANMTASMQNMDILDSKSLKRRNGYTRVTASPVNGANQVKALWRMYFADGTKQWVCVSGTALVALGSLTTGGRAEAEDVMVAASSSGWAVSSVAECSGGEAAQSGPSSGRFVVPSCDRFTVGVFGVLNPAYPAEGLTGSLKIDGGAWASFSGGAVAAPTFSYSGLSATAHTVYIKLNLGHLPVRPYVDYFDYATAVTAAHKDTTITATSTEFGFAMFKNKLYYGSAYDNIRSYDGTNTAAVSASGSCKGAYLVENKLRLFAAGDFTDPAKVFYTDLDYPEDWTGGGNLYLAGKDTVGGVTGVAVWRKRIYTFYTNRVYALDTTGLPENWDTGGEPISHRIGCIAPKSLARVPNGLVFLSTEGVHLYGIGDEFTQEPGFTLLSDNITPTIMSFTSAQRAAACGAYYANRYWLAIGDTVLVYRFPESGLTGSWTLYRYSGISITCLHVTRGDEYGLFAGTSDGRIVQLDVGTNDGGNDISDYYVTPPIAPGGMEVIKHFRPAVDVGVEADTTQSLTVTPYTDDVSGTAQTVTVTPNTSVQTIRVPLSARGRALQLKLSASGAGQPRTLTSIGVSFIPPRMR